MKRIIEFIRNKKYMIAGISLGIFVYISLLLPVALDQMINYSDSIFAVWKDIGFTMFSLILLILIGIFVGKLMEDYFNGRYRR